MATSKKQTRYISVIDAAKELGLVDSRIRQLLRAGDIDGVKIGERTWMVEKNSVEKMKEKKLQKTS